MANEIEDVDEITTRTKKVTIDDDSDIWEEISQTDDIIVEETDDEEIHNQQQDGATVSVNLQTPSVGMHYENIEHMFASYLAFARSRGFCVAKKSASKGGGSVRRYQTITCDRGRKYTPKKMSKRINCPARISAKLLDNGLWQVTKFEDEHNHDLEPSMSRLMRGHRFLNSNTKRKLEANDVAGIRPSKSIRILEVHAGGPDKLDCLPKDCRNYVEKSRKLKLGMGDADCINHMFLRMQQNNRSFFHLIHTDEYGRLDRVFWVHPRSRESYEDFSDVVSVDSTYLVNRYKMPFVTIVGINHHGQSILLGSALISHEDTDTYIWLFSTWLVAMGGRAPIAIMTDQCESMGNAIRTVMPNTIRRYCIWHILCKLPEKFRGIVEHNRAKNEFKAVIYDSLTKRMFVRNWNQFIAKYDLERNEWLIKLFEDREFWVPVYVNHIFWAGMLSTQRSESMHAFFDGYVHARSTLKQFVEQYEIAFRNKVEKEFFADFKSKNSVIWCLTFYEWESQFQRAYTNSMFLKFQNELKRMWYCHVISGSDELEAASDEEFNEEGSEKFKIREKSLVNDWYVKQFIYTVLYKEEGCFLKCNCKKFESAGVLCAHILKVVSLKDIRQIPERYILRRWRKDIVRRHSRIFFDGEYPTMSPEYEKYRELEKMFNVVVDIALLSDARMNRFKQILTEAKEEVTGCPIDNLQANVATVVERGSDDMNQGLTNVVLNPNIMATRGRPRINRFRSRNEGGRRGGRRGNSGVGTCHSQQNGRRRNTRRCGNSIVHQFSNEQIVGDGRILTNTQSEMRNFDLNIAVDEFPEVFFSTL